MAWHPLDAELADGVLTVWLAAAVQPHASVHASGLAMERLLQTIANDPEVRVLVLRDLGEGFPVGLSAGEPEAAAAVGQALDRCVDLLSHLPQPVVGVVHGRCRDAALQILEACDIAYAADNAQFDDPSVDAAQAERAGLLTLTFAPAELDGETAALAHDLASKDPLVLRFTKETLRQVPAVSWEEVLDFNAAKTAELKSLQAGRPSARAFAVESFLSGKSKPGLGR